jgi:hypothetical protein
MYRCPDDNYLKRKIYVSKIVGFGLVGEVRNRLNHMTLGDWADRGTPIA